MPTQTVQELAHLAVAIFRAMGSDQTQAQIVGRHLAR
jgi:LDH2 family malate/lactate/ureidoglycolate dehydrogenase